MRESGSVSKQRKINVKLFKHGHAFFTHPVYGKVEIIDVNRDMAVVLALSEEEQIEIDIGLLKPVISATSRKHPEHETADTDGLNVLCRFCERKCADKDKQHHEVKLKLFDDCIKIMLDDLGVFFEYLRLKSPAGKTICAARSFFHYAITNRIVFMYHDRTKNTREIIPPSSVITFLKEALIRWGFNVPPDFNFEPLEKLLKKSMDYSTNGNVDPGESVRNVVTDCPRCGDTLTIALNDSDKEQLSKGSRYIHKIVEHGNHGVNVFIDSEYRVRRKSAVQIVKSIICP